MPARPETLILLVDDDPAKRYTIAKTLFRAGFEVQEAGTGSEALRLVASLPDLVVLDVKLPDMDGFEVCRRIKSDPVTTAIPVLHISTTFVDIEAKVHGLDSGADGYLTNVAEPMELVATVRALLRARRAEDAARLSKHQWQTTFDAISDGVLLLDSSGRVVQSNRTAEHILGQPWTDIVGKNLAELWNEPTERDVSLFDRMRNSGERESKDISRGDRWLHVAIDPLRDVGKAVNGALCLVSDITSRKRMEMQLLRQAEKLHQDGQRKDEFLAMLAHELRNPLAPLANVLQIIGSQVRGNSLIEESLEIARRQIHHMAPPSGRPLRHLAHHPRQDRTQENHARPQYDRGTRHRSRASLTVAMRHDLAISLSSEPLAVEGDATRLEQVVLNLLNNAAKYTEPGGRITLTLARENADAVLVVQDSGVGHHSRDATKNLRPFCAGRPFVRSRRGGLGIGLTLVRRLVEFHNGTISVFTPAPGKGASFWCESRSPSNPLGSRPSIRSPKTRPGVIFVYSSLMTIATAPERWPRSWSWTATRCSVPLTDPR